MRRIHIVGIAPRSGTTLLVEAMRACFAIDASHDGQVPLQVRALGEIHLSKEPGDIAVIGPRLRLDPRLYVVCLVRDPRDVVVSELWKHPGRYHVDLAQVQSHLKIFRACREHPRFIVVRYEEFVDDPSATQLDLEQRMAFLKRKADFRDYHRVAVSVAEIPKASMHGVRPIDTASIGNWRNHLARIADQREGMTEVLVELGYEEDGAWERILEGVVPLRQSPLPADPGRKALWIPPVVRRPLRLAWRYLRRPFGSWAQGLPEGLRGLFEYAVGSPRG